MNGPQEETRPVNGDADAPASEPSRPAAGPRPADVARRALRAARERDTLGAAAGTSRLRGRTG